MSYQRTILFAPEDAQAYNCQAKAYYSLENYLEAGTAYKKAVQLDPNYSDAYVEHIDAFFNQGEKLYELRQYRGALTLYRRTIQFDPDNAQAYAGQGNSLFELERSEAAGAAYRKAIELDAGYQQTYAKQRDILFEQSQKLLNQQRYYLEAEALNKRALQFDPSIAQSFINQAEKLVNHGKNLCIQRQFQEALSFFEQAILLLPNNASVYAELEKRFLN